MPDIVPAMHFFSIRGLDCPGINLAQRRVAESFLISCAQDMGLGILSEPYSKVCEPSYPGYNGIAANILLANNGYITVATFVPTGEAWIHFAPIVSEGQRLTVIMKMSHQIFQCFGTRKFLMELSPVNLEQLAKMRARLLEMRQLCHLGH